MHSFLLLACFVLAVTEYFLGSAHMIPDERLSTNKVVVSSPLSQSIEILPSPVVIVELPKSARKTKKTKKQKKNTLKKHSPPPPNCIPTGENCKSPSSVCCDVCAFCQCRLFRTVCFCRMGNPHC